MNNAITKDQFVAVLEAAGIDAARRDRLHQELERRHPAAHESFLVWLGLGAAEIARLRAASRPAN